MTVEGGNNPIIGNQSGETAGDLIVRPPFNSSYDIATISEQDRFVGPRALELFQREIIRPVPWNIRDGRIDISIKPTRIEAIEQATDPGYAAGLSERVILTEGLDREVISPELASVIAQFKMIEDFLPDFMGRAAGIFRGNLGISASYNQWGREELQHSLAAGLILTQTGHKTTEQLVEDQMAGLLKTWELPFPEPRQVVLYAVFQELQTRDAYQALSRRALEEDAPITAKILSLIARDEAYHGGGYMKFARIYHELDPQGTIEDAVHVASNFRMPALNLLPNQRANVRNAMAVGVYAGDYGQTTLRRSLKSLGFVPDDRIDQAVDTYGASQERFRGLYERSRKVTSSSVIIPE